MWIGRPLIQWPMGVNRMSQCMTYGPIGMLQLKGARVCATRGLMSCTTMGEGAMLQFKRPNSFVIIHISQSSTLERITSIE